MDETKAIAAFTALAHPKRLAVFRELVRLFPEALPAGETARLCDAPHNTMSAHLAVLARAGLVTATRESRSILYRADFDGFRGVVAFLTDDCCAGRPEICAPLLSSTAAPCACPPEPTP